ncbi:kelch repeat-containing protein [Amycolatopsis sp. NPDC051371]|uniref:Kelch repeat-containing protein n=1 Tax=Amycolatopsis sp. NPDC051371 TaxID=3155800 RepID=UPI003434231E
MNGPAREWQERSPLRVARGGHDVATTRGRIYVVGGFGTTELLNAVESRRTQGDGEWHSVAPMRIRRAIDQTRLLSREL